MTKQTKHVAEIQSSPADKFRFWLTKLAFEIVVVFVGVSIAFLVESAKQDRITRERAVRILEVIQLEFSQQIAWWAHYSDSIKVSYNSWEQDRKKGKHPRPFFVRIPGAEHPSSGAWQAALASDVLGVIDAQLVREIGNVYNEKTGVGDRFARYMANTETVVFPELSKPSNFFYDSNTGELKPQFAGNLLLLLEVVAQGDRVDDVWLKSLHHQIEQELHRLRGK